MEGYAFAAYLGEAVVVTSWFSYLIIMVVMILGAKRLSWFPHYLSFDSPIFRAQLTLVLLGFPSSLAEFIVNRQAHDGKDYLCGPFWHVNGAVYIFGKGVMYLFLNLKARAASGGSHFHLQGPLYNRVLRLGSLGLLGIPVICILGAVLIHGEMVYDLDGYGNFCSVRCPAWLAGAFAMADFGLSVVYFALFYLPIQKVIGFQKETRLSQQTGSGDQKGQLTADVLHRNFLATVSTLTTCLSFMGVVIYTSFYPEHSKIMVIFPLCGNIDSVVAIWSSMYATYPAWKFSHLKIAGEIARGSTPIQSPSNQTKLTQDKDTADNKRTSTQVSKETQKSVDPL
eukprot:TRINITY_DN26391_c0_g1_i1.p1 TRINITY_DN26391_c0_g1~~TRINITY_DN26391_c0_g1_i1.p1  ORF type:complete len:340 (-),score=45.77 TRINITY_DN26391_c0_g1_i1:151-1170(-)